VDYAVAGALDGTDGIVRIVLSYDLGCQYGINFVPRMEARFPHLKGRLHRVVFLVPKMHLYGHKEDCQYLYSFNFTPGVGRTEGETPERGWAIVNLHAGSTFEMNGGHRHDSLNTELTDMNFKKMINLGKCILSCRLSLEFCYLNSRKNIRQEVRGKHQGARYRRRRFRRTQRLDTPFPDFQMA